MSCIAYVAQLTQLTLIIVEVCIYVYIIHKYTLNKMRAYNLQPSDKISQDRLFNPLTLPPSLFLKGEFTNSPKNKMGVSMLFFFFFL